LLPPFTGTGSIKSPALIAIALAPVLALFACTQDGVARPRAMPTTKPAALEASEHLAEDIQADIAVRAWRSVDGKLADLLAHLDGVTASIEVDQRARQAETLKEYRGGLDSLMARVARRDRLGALEAANGLCRTLTAIAAGYPDRIPVSVTLLDVSGRDVIYRAEDQRWTDASVSVAEIRGLYGGIAAHVAARDSVLDARVRGELDALDAGVRARNASTVGSAGNALLDDVDRIERTY
jgi:hypothetical protein